MTPQAEELLSYDGVSRKVVEWWAKTAKQESWPSNSTCLASGSSDYDCDDSRELACLDLLGIREARLDPLRPESHLGREVGQVGSAVGDDIRTLSRGSPRQARQDGLSEPCPSVRHHKVADPFPFFAF